MRKVRVLHLELDEHLGGIESFLFNLYSQIDRSKIQFDFVTRADNPAKGKELERLGANIYKVSSYRNPLRYMKDLDAVLRKGYDIIHIHKNSAAVVMPFIVAYKHRDVAVFVHSHNTRPSIGKFSIILHRINKSLVWRYSDEHFACSQVAGEWLYGTKKKFDVLKNGILVENYLFKEDIRKSKRKELGIGSSEFVIGHVGRFTEQKNHLRLIKIFDAVLKQKEDSRLFLVGDGELRLNISEYIKEHHLENNVRFLGVRNDVAELLMAMDAFLMPSLYEGLPIVCVEAQCSGLSVYLSDTISKETEICSAVTWFSLDDLDEDIANIMVKNVGNSVEIRKIRNQEVMRAGFDMKNTAEYLCQKYIERVLCKL